MDEKPSAETTHGKRGQFKLRSLLVALVWIAMILAICVHYQRASARQRQVIESLGLGRSNRPVRHVWQPTPPAPLPAQP